MNGLQHLTTTVFFTKISEVDIKISSAGGLVKKTDYDAKVKDIEGKYFITADYNKLTSDILDVKMKQKELVKKSDTDKIVINIIRKLHQIKQSI